MKYKKLNQYFTIKEDEPKKKFNFKRDQIHFMLNLLRENCTFKFEVIYTLSVNAKIVFRAKSESIKTIKKDPKFIKLQNLARSSKNAYLFNICAVSNEMNWHPLETIAKLNALAVEYDGFLIKTGYAIYLKIKEEKANQEKEKISLKMENVHKNMKSLLKLKVKKHLERKLRRLDLFYYILDQALKKFPLDEQTAEKSQFVQRKIEKYFSMDELKFVNDFIGWENLKKSLPLEFIEKKGFYIYIL